MPLRFAPHCIKPLLLTLALALPVQAADPALNDVAAVPQLGERGREGYRTFLQSGQHRAFVIAPGGGWAWRSDMGSEKNALSLALSDCAENNTLPCVPYAIDKKVVFDAAQWPKLWGPYKSAAEAAKSGEGVVLGQRFPDLLLTDPKGKPFRLSSLRGKVVVLHFWGTWCPSCRRELPEFVKLQFALRKDRDIDFVFAQVREPVDAARAWLRQEKLRLPLYDSGVRTGSDDQLRLSNGRSMSDRAIAPVFPTTYVLDRHGIVVFSFRGSSNDWSQYLAFLRDVAMYSGR